MAGTIVVNSPNNINEAQIKEARNAVLKVEDNGSMEVEDYLKNALKFMG